MLLSWQGFFRLQIVSPLFGVHLLFDECLSTMGCFRRYIVFLLVKVISSAFVSVPYENQFLVAGDAGGLHVIVMVGVDRSLEALLYSLTSFTTLQNVSPSFGVLLLFSKTEGDFSCPWVLTAREIGPIEVISLLVWRRPLLSG